MNDSAEFAPQLYPPFPKDTNPVIHLSTVSLSELLAGSDAEQARLFEICRTQGFFYLDFSGTKSESLVKEAEAIGRLSETVFKLPLEEKQDKEPKKPFSLLGYKLVGKTKTDDQGIPDTAEFMNVGKDDILDTPHHIPTTPPAIVFESANRAMLASFVVGCHGVGLDIMSVLATKMDLPKDVFSHSNRLKAPCDSHCRMIRGPSRRSTDLPEIQTPGHTDFGTITILFNWLGGLQVWSEPSRGNFHKQFEGDQPEGAAGQWLWVKPKPGHAIVNLGDAAVRFTGGILCSARHRVVPAPGEQGLWPRYSVVYFIRPNDEVVMKRLQGGMVPPLPEGEEEEELTAAQHQQKKFRAMQEGARAVNTAKTDRN
ncbi:hypothetical protein LTS08_006227 [Lithohypha guttulata]|nr:hypothetical protein LTS08_006227 [Lithohypha guttulata]